MEDLPTFPALLAKQGYVFEQRHGKGGQSFTSRIKKDGKAFCLKQPKISKEKSFSTLQKFRLLQEAEALKALGGQGTPNVIDWAADDEPFILMEWIHGKTLSDTTNGQPQSFISTIQMITQLCTILDRVHEIRIIHRDIKPDNILIAVDGELKLIDFGICRMDNSNHDFHTKREDELGNRFLRLPELGKGEKTPSSVSDVTFVVGVLFFMLTGKSPNILLDAYGKPPHYREEISHLINGDRWLVYLFDKGFANNIDQRFQSTQELLSFINRWRNMEENSGDNALESLRDMFNSQEHTRRGEVVANVLEAHRRFLDQLDLRSLPSFYANVSGPGLVSDRKIECNCYFYFKLSRIQLLQCRLVSLISQDYLLVELMCDFENNSWRKKAHETIMASQILDDYKTLGKEVMQEFAKRARVFGDEQARSFKTD